MSRFAFIPGRLLQAVPVVFGVSLAVFFMAHLLPGDPAIAILGDRATPESIEALRSSLGLDQPLWQQYLLFLGRIVQGDFGTSFTYQRPVSEVLVQAIPTTLFLLLFALVLAIIISVPLAALAASRPAGVRDLGVRTFTLLGQGMPQFWVGIMVILIAALRLRWFPVGGYGSTALDHLYYLALPALTLAIAMSPTIIRSLRSSMIDALNSDFVMTARSKGSFGAGLLVHHILRNAIIPTVSVIGVNLSYLVGGSIVIEKVFALPGIGSLMLNSIFARDFPTIQAVTLFVALFVVVVGVLTDVLYVVLDPRVTLSRGGAK